MDQRHDLTATLADLDDQPQAALDAQFQQRPRVGV
jgi:hypothetical protein